MGTIGTKNQIIIKRGDSVSSLLNFRCGVSEMDDFIHDRENGLQKMMQLNLINVWFVYFSDELIAFFALSKDKLVLNSEDKNMMKLDCKTTLPFDDFFWEQDKFSSIEISYFAVSSHHQKKGYGKFLLAIIEKKVKEEDKLTPTLFLTVDALVLSNHDASIFYKKCGFKPSEYDKLKSYSDDTSTENSCTLRMYKSIY